MGFILGLFLGLYWVFIGGFVLGLYWAYMLFILGLILGTTKFVFDAETERKVSKDQGNSVLCYVFLHKLAFTCSHRHFKVRLPETLD